MSTKPSRKLISSKCAVLYFELYAPKFNYDPEEIKIKIAGLKLGERLHEKLLTEDEALFALENKDMFIIVPLVSYGLNRGAALKKYMADMKAKKCKVENYATLGKKYLSINQIKKILVKDDKKMLETLNHYY